MFLESVNERIGVLEKSKALLQQPFEEAASATVDALRKGNRIFFCGNGGSAGDSQHIATELVAKLAKRRAALPALALTTNSSLLTAISNDDGFAQVFARQVEAHARRGDVLVGISTSGGSPNVLEAFRTARSIGLKTIGFCGSRGWNEPDLVDITLAVPADDTQSIQEVHIFLGHLICHRVESDLFDD